MSKRIIFLSGALILQVALLVIVFYKPKVLDSNFGLSEIVQNIIDTITIEDKDHNRLTLVKNNNAWLIPEYKNLPAEEKKVKQLLSQLKASQFRAPIATTLQSQERFGVTENNFERKISLSANSQSLLDLFVGEQVGIKKSFVREIKDNNIFEVSLAHHELAANPQDWFMKDILQPKGMNKIQGENFSLVLKDKEWQLELPDNSDENIKINQENIDAIVTQFQYLKLLGLASQTDISSLKQPSKKIEVVADDHVITYEFFNASERSILKSSLNENYFYVSKPFAESVIGWEKQKFIAM